MGFEFLTAVVDNSFVFWGMPLCNSVEVNQHFGGTFRYHAQGRKVS